LKIFFKGGFLEVLKSVSDYPGIRLENIA